MYSGCRVELIFIHRNHFLDSLQERVPGCRFRSSQIFMLSQHPFHSLANQKTEITTVLPVHLLEMLISMITEWVNSSSVLMANLWSLTLAISSRVATWSCGMTLEAVPIPGTLTTLLVLFSVHFIPTHCFAQWYNLL